MSNNNKLRDDVVNVLALVFLIGLLILFPIKVKK